MINDTLSLFYKTLKLRHYGGRCIRRIFFSLLWSCPGKNQAMYTALSRTCHVTLKTLYDTYDVTKYSMHND